MRQVKYAVALTPDVDGGYVVTCRDLPMLITQGDGLAHALGEAVDALEEVVAFHFSEGIALPEASVGRPEEHWIEIAVGE